jgi:hypothetical protein
MSQTPRKERLWLSLLVNIGAPLVILTTLNNLIGPLGTLLLASLFPLSYGIYDYLKSGRKNVYSVISIAGVLVNAGVGLLRLAPEWIAWKEAAIPFILGVLTAASVNTPFPAWRLIYNDYGYATERISAALRTRGKEAEFQRLLRDITFLYAGSFFLSSVLNYVLARVLLKSRPGTEAFNAELARMTVLTWPVIVLPVCVVLIATSAYLSYRLWRLTGLPLNMLHMKGVKRS